MIVLFSKSNKTRRQERNIKAAGYTLVVVWECKSPGYKALNLSPKTVVYPSAIVYDFEFYLDKTKAYNPSSELTIGICHAGVYGGIREQGDEIAPVKGRRIGNNCMREPSTFDG